MNSHNLSRWMKWSEDVRLLPVLAHCQIVGNKTHIAVIPVC